MGLTAKAWRYVLVLGVGAVAGYLVVPGAMRRDTLFLAVEVASVLGILIGVRVNRPNDRVAWYLLALGGAAFTSGDLIAHADHLAPRVVSPDPSAGYGLYLAGYLCTFAAVIRLGRDPAHSRRREDYADAAIITLGATAVSWYFVMASSV